VIIPSRSIARSDSVSTFGVTARSATWSSEKRRGPSRRHTMILAVHLSPIRMGVGPGSQLANRSGSSGSRTGPR